MLTFNRLQKHDIQARRFNCLDLCKSTVLLASAGLLDMGPGEFYRGLAPAAGAFDELTDFFATKGAIELACAYLRLNSQQRAKLVDLAQVIVPSAETI